MLRSSADDAVSGRRGDVVYFLLQFDGKLSEVGFARFFLCPQVMEDDAVGERIPHLPVPEVAAKMVAGMRS